MGQFTHKGKTQITSERSHLFLLSNSKWGLNFNIINISSGENKLYLNEAEARIIWFCSGLGGSIQRNKQDDKKKKKLPHTKLHKALKIMVALWDLLWNDQSQPCYCVEPKDWGPGTQWPSTWFWESPPTQWPPRKQVKSPASLECGVAGTVLGARIA